MATEQDRKTFDRIANQGSIPVLEFPKFPEALKKDPTFKAAFDLMERQMDRWRKTLGGGASSGSATLQVIRTGSGGGGSSGGGSGIVPPTPETIEEIFIRLHSLEILDWIM